MKIINLKAENVKKLIAVDITPDENMVVISGKNGAGKSSLLDSIYYALAGKSVIPQKPIREGEDKASIQLDLGEVIVERKFTEAGTTVKVSTADGARYQNPQNLLNELLNSICFDPLLFSRLKPKDQYNEMKDILGLGDEIEKIETQIKEIYDDRRDTNRSLKEGESYVENLKSEIPDNTPKESIDVSAEVENLKRLEGIKGAFQDKEDECKRQSELVLTRQATIQEIEEKLEKAKQWLKEAEEKRDSLSSELKTFVLPEQSKFDEVNEKINSATEINENVAKRKTLENYNIRIKELSEKSQASTSKIEELELSKKSLISKAKLPVEGLELKEGQVFFNGIPFDQLCSAETLRISTALAMSANPKLRIVRIQDGSLLDSDGMKALESLAKENDFQVWIEVVESSDSMAIIIEEGQIKECGKNQEKEQLLV